MKILALADLHGRPDVLIRLEGALTAADLLLLAGDITNFGGRPEAEAILARLAALPIPVRLVHGNCDRAEAAAAFTAAGLNLDGRAERFGGLAIAGLGGSLPCPSPTCLEEDDESLGARLETALASVAASEPLLLLVHQPPYASGADRAHGGRDVGSRAIRAIIERRQPLAVICGHIHEGHGVFRLGRTHLLNPGAARGGHHAWIELDGDRVRVAELRRGG